ncbi:MAG: hypothetical protein ILP24_05850 [Paludibacteraceae bacterium]|nr:hypothetical protein [Paludibacteraceae bacterium]
MKFAAAHYIFSPYGDIFKHALLEIASGEILHFENKSSQTERAYTVFYNGIICPDFWGIPAKDIAQILLDQQKKNPEKNIFGILESFRQNSADRWIIIENINLQTLHLEFMPVVSIIPASRTL